MLKDTDNAPAQTFEFISVVLNYWKAIREETFL
jgi:hypothetical protein